MTSPSLPVPQQAAKNTWDCVHHGEDLHRMSSAGMDAGARERAQGAQEVPLDIREFSSYHLHRAITHSGDMLVGHTETAFQAGVHRKVSFVH